MIGEQDMGSDGNDELTYLSSAALAAQVLASTVMVRGWIKEGNLPAHAVARTYRAMPRSAGERSLNRWPGASGTGETA